MNFDISCFFFFFWLATYKGMWDLNYPPGTKPGPLQWKHWVLTPGPPGMSPGNFYISVVGLLVFLPHSLIGNRRVVSETFCASPVLNQCLVLNCSQPSALVCWVNKWINVQWIHEQQQSYSKEQAKAPYFLYPHPYRRDQPSSMKSIQQRLTEPWGSVTEPRHFTSVYLRSEDPGHKFPCL